MPRPARIWGAALLALALLGATGCSASGGDNATSAGQTTGDATDSGASTDEPDGSGGSELPLADAASATQAAIDQGDGLGECPMGSPEQWVNAVSAEHPDLLPARMVEDTIEDGQVFSGGEVDIVYCGLVAFGDTAVEEVRVDVSPTDDVDLATYVGEEWGDIEDFAVEEADGFAGGEVDTLCEAGRRCVATWQGSGLFVAVSVKGADVGPTDATDAAELLVPLAITELAG